MVMYIPGDRDMPEWWGEQDAAILAGEVAKLDQLPRASNTQPAPLVPGAPTTPPARPWWRTPSDIAALIVFCAALGLILLFAFTTPRSTAPTPGDIIVIPTTYGPPGPNGGPQFTTMPGSR